MPIATHNYILARPHPASPRGLRSKQVNDEPRIRTVEYWPIRRTIGLASISELVKGDEWKPVRLLHS
jgi:hypothetical protein